MNVLLGVLMKQHVILTRSLATEDDGNCEYDSCSGCTYEYACNYDSEATISNNQLCELDATCYGCTDPESPNYDALASNDDGSCNYGGCTDENACNYNPQADFDNESCFYQCQDCSLDFDFGDASFGFSPDFSVGESLENGTVNTDYYDVIHMLMPLYASDIDSTLPALELDSLESNQYYIN